MEEKIMSSAEDKVAAASNNLSANDDFGGVYFSTYDYGKFSFLKGNRAISAAHVKELVKAFKEEGYHLTIITVNHKGQIIDGQHRWEAIKALAAEGIVLPIYYVIDPKATLTTCIAVNSHSRNWPFRAYVDAGAVEEDNPNRESYIMLQALCNEYKNSVPETVIASICSGEWNHKTRWDDIKRQNFKIAYKPTRIRAKLNLLTRFRDCRCQFPVYENAARALFFILQFLKKNEKTLHNKIIALKNNNKTKTFKFDNVPDVVAEMEKVFYGSKAREEVASWKEIYSAYMKGKTMNEINEFYGKTAKEGPIDEAEEDVEEELAMEPEVKEAVSEPEKMTFSIPKPDLIDMRKILDGTLRNPFKADSDIAETSTGKK